jgi:hypothetical protein
MTRCSLLGSFACGGHARCGCRRHHCHELMPAQRDRAPSCAARQRLRSASRALKMAQHHCGCVNCKSGRWRRGVSDPRRDACCPLVEADMRYVTVPWAARARAALTIHRRSADFLLA